MVARGINCADSIFEVDLQRAMLCQSHINYMYFVYKKFPEIDSASKAALGTKLQVVMTISILFSDVYVIKWGKDRLKCRWSAKIHGQIQHPV